MNRRELMQLGVTTLALSAVGRGAFAQEAASPAGFPMDVYSKNLQWLRNAPEVAKVVTDMGFSSIDLTVLPYPGHVDPARVATDLPAYVTALKSSGVTVSAITADITDADSPNAEAILAAASGAGIRYYSWGGFKYDLTRPLGPQLDALKPRIQRLVRLNQRYNMKALYQPQRGAENVGSVFFDFLNVLKDFDPRYVAFRYDTAALLQTSTDAMVSQLRLGAPYIGGMALNDAVVRLELPVWDQGPFIGEPRELLAPNGGGDNQGNAGGTWEAIGGGGRPLPYRFRPVQLGTGMVDLTTIGAVLKEIAFSGPAECQILWDAGGPETGSDKLTVPPAEAMGLIKHDRLIVNQGFEAPWNTDVAKPPFMEREEQQPQPSPEAMLRRAIRILG